MTDEDALSFLIEYLRDPSREKPQNDGADLDIKAVAWAYMVKHEGVPSSGRIDSHEARVETRAEPFTNAAWQLCRIGVLRPGQRGSPVNAAAYAQFYAFTDYGRTWIASPREDQVFVSPDRSAKLLGRYHGRFGDAFLQRGIEAGECYRAGLYLACAAMCGAGREAILIAVARERMKDEEVEKIYLATGGRRGLEKRALGKLTDRTRREFIELSRSLDFWRDDAAHGRPSRVDEPEAFRALQLLLRLAQFVDAYVPTED